MSGDNTLDNLMKAFAGEAQVNRKYLAYAKKAEKKRHALNCLGQLPMLKPCTLLNILK